MKDVIIIGAGVSGCAIARELSRYELSVCVIEKESDVGEGTSKANSGIVHGGFDAKPGSLKAKLNVEGNRMMEEMAKKLDFPFRRNGSLVICHREEEVGALKNLLEQGKANRVEGMRLLGREEALKLEPNLSGEIYAALHIPTGGIVCPFGMNIAYAENAAENGVEFLLETEVLAIRPLETGYLIQTDQKDLETRCVVNAAGVYADVFHNMVSAQKIHITPRKGEYCLMDKEVGGLVDHTIFQLPTEKGKGVLVTPTVHGNLLVGPTAVDIEEKEGTFTTAEGLKEVLEKSGRSVRSVPKRKIITSFAGLRAHEDGGEFVIGEVPDAEGFIDVAGIESPGLSSAPAIGVYVKDLLVKKLLPEPKQQFIETRKDILRFMELSEEEKHAVMQKEPAYGTMVCRCEQVTEGEVLDAIRRPLGARTLDGIKRRTRAEMGRCQAGFCTPKLMELLARELQIELKEVRKSGRRKRHEAI
ncbi:NAD(P)/FAD-dependent oxidoreductase [Suipraeoptans intestinalis]|uniref:NAD(P)/FAD-dependent oxidoreductase n=1 Tax=Suipraeoptans intestinalis TaxID=2606628 RepID=UPI0023F3E1E3|nr:NAD(P)/FAD-dependent oxidoreductase [Suipraeoptans intestinalis]MDD7770355.1 NAD(P)/FAD-dependent oxidoreductase [Suipraeoptans intestinalis]MDY3121324.1 NAD(P)/FAD-dependent oxidoreductase [Suipraeoptans intestinalis]